MIFRQVDEIKQGHKTQTRRVVKADDVALMSHDESLYLGVCRNGRLLYCAGRSYSVVPKRGAASVGRIVINRIDQERLQDITEDAARAEGVGSVAEYQTLWETINKTPGTRWDDNPLVWVYSFSYIDIPF